MIICTYYLKFKEPLTQTWVEGKNEMIAHTKEEADGILTEWERYLSRNYGANFELRFCDWGNEK